jgi:CRISPR-associated protein Cas1
MSGKRRNSGKAPVDDTLQSHHLAEKTTDNPLVRVMALHALAYCERLFYLEEVEEIRVADGNVYAGRRLHEKLDKGTDTYTMELASERLGLRGKADCVRRSSGELIVFEHKRGRSKQGKEAWPSDRLQALAYALLLSEHTGEGVREARIRYHADNTTVRLEVEEEKAREEVCAAVSRAVELRESIGRPPVSASEYQCRTCSLAPVCLPEEERFAGHGREKARRLFPADDDRRVIHLVEQGAAIRRDGEQLIIALPDGTRKSLPGKLISALVLHGNIQISTQAIHFCAANSIGVHWLSYGGFYVGAFSQGGGNVQRRIRQFQALQDDRLRFLLSCRLVSAKVENQLRYLLRATRGKETPERSAVVTAGLDQLRAILKELTALLADAEQGAIVPLDTIRGFEGKAGEVYFSLLPLLLKVGPENLLAFSGRNRRPPRDPFNALLSFGYALLYRDCMNGLLSVGLGPCFGFMHSPRSAAYPLAMDLMDLFRLLLWDIPLIGSVNRGQWLKDDFVVTGEQVWLNVDGRRKAIQIYENRKQEKWKHPVLQYSLSYGRTIELESRLLEKEWTGEPGLFAGLRLR